METKPPKPRIQIPAASKRPSSSSFSNSDSYREESPHSPLRFHSPLRSDHDPEPELPDSAYSSPITSPPSTAAPPPQFEVSPALSPLHVIAPMKASGPPTPVTTTLSKAVAGREEGTSVRKVGPDRMGSSAAALLLRRSGNEDLIRVVELGLRISEVVFSLISFSVMAADKTEGWSGDSFDRYKEYRYCLVVNVIAFVYSLLQVYDLGYIIATGKHLIRRHLHRLFNFLIDQILAYLLMSASSSAATRVNDWQSNWGKDKFTEMATGSIVVSFLAFFAFAASSVISGYNLCNYGAI